MNFISNNFLDELRSKVSLVEIVRKSIKLTRKGRDWWGCCPFHKEKTPSFTVNDEKGFYHCFGCSEHGDIIGFEMKVNHLTFYEAVEKLAHIAGMEMPKPTVADMAKEEKRVSLFDVMEKACQFFQNSLYQPSGQEALEYIKKREISDKTMKDFRLGYAPSGNALRDFMASQNITMEQMKQVGLCASNNDSTYDYFRDRLIFPIMDKRSKVIAFGGRIMGAGEPKYLNSPESDLFHKSNVLYAYDKARISARKNNSVIVVEGYMDVIALHQAGIDYAVAPLGTALTEMQIQGLWQLANEPILCFDGDEAGKKAAFRAVPRVLPILKEGHSLQFSWMPNGQDPDDVIRVMGREAFLDIAKNSTPLADVVWKLVLGDNNLNTPEQKAYIEKKNNEFIAPISNEAIRKYYAQDLKNKLYNHLYQQRALNNKKAKKNPLMHNLERKLIIDDEKFKNLISYILTYPEVAGNFIEQIATIESNNNYLNKRLMSLLDKLSDNPETIQNEDKSDFSLYIEMLKRKYAKEEYPNSIVAADIDKELKSLSLISLVNEIKKLETELFVEYNEDKVITLKNLIAEKNNLEFSLDTD